MQELFLLQVLVLCMSNEKDRNNTTLLLRKSTLTWNHRKMKSLTRIHLLKLTLLGKEFIWFFMTMRLYQLLRLTLLIVALKLCIQEWQDLQNKKWNGETFQIAVLGFSFTKSINSISEITALDKMQHKAAMIDCNNYYYNYWVLLKLR